MFQSRVQVDRENEKGHMTRKTQEFLTAVELVLFFSVASSVKVKFYIPLWLPLETIFAGNACEGVGLIDGRFDLTTCRVRFAICYQDGRMIKRN